MEDLVIGKLNDKSALPWSLLLLADPSREVIGKYIQESDVYTVRKNDVTVGVYVLKNISRDRVELKNIAVDEKYQGQGIGKKLVLDSIERARDQGMKMIEVGTGNSSFSQLALYQKCGFRITGVEKDFFVKSYKEEIIENGIRCTDMIRLAIDL